VGVLDRENDVTNRFSDVIHCFAVVCSWGSAVWKFSKRRNSEGQTEVSTWSLFQMPYGGAFRKKCPMTEASSAPTDGVAMTTQMRAVFPPPDDRSEVYLPAQLHKGNNILNISAVLDTVQVVWYQRDVQQQVNFVILNCLQLIIHKSVWLVLRAYTLLLMIWGILLMWFVLRLWMNFS
jgi:hypothetical protein